MGEPGEDEPAGPGVQGWIGGDGGEAVGEDGLVGTVDFEGDDDDIERAEVLGVVGQGGDVVVAGGEPVAAPAVGCGRWGRSGAARPRRRKDRPRSRRRERRSRWPSRSPATSSGPGRRPGASSDVRRFSGPTRSSDTVPTARPSRPMPIPLPSIHLTRPATDDTRAVSLYRHGGGPDLNRRPGTTPSAGS